MAILAKSDFDKRDIADLGVVVPVNLKDASFHIISAEQSGEPGKVGYMKIYAKARPAFTEKGYYADIWVKYDLTILQIIAEADRLFATIAETFKRDSERVKPHGSV